MSSMTIAWGRVELHSLSYVNESGSLIVAGSQFEMFARPSPICGVIGKALDPRYTFEEYSELENLHGIAAVMPYADDSEIALIALDPTEPEEIIPHQELILDQYRMFLARVAGLH